MKPLKTIGLCSIVMLTLAATVAADASAKVPTWFQCVKAAKSGKTFSGQYTSKSCQQADEVMTGGKFELQEGVGKHKAFKGKGGAATLTVTTSLGDASVECVSSKDSGTPALPNLETGVAVTYKGCKMLGSKDCTSTGAHSGEVKLTGLRGEFDYVEESSTTAVGLKLESEAHPGPDGELAKFSCEGLETTVTGALKGIQSRDINVASKDSETTYSGQGQTTVNKGEDLMIRAEVETAETTKSLLIGEVVPHENGGDAKKEEITPVRFVAAKSGTVEEICYETSGYLYNPTETSLVLGIQEQVGGKPGKVLGEGTYPGKLGTNSIACVAVPKVPITKGKTYYLSFLPLGGAVTYWYGKSETILYSVEHKKLVEGPPEKYEWREEAEEAPIGIWANGT